ncbi:hypothetical protein Q9L42_013980 [Methylomarinum sp. Ch1-1]|uniref:Uncharacterized protein n=1 Tax=Methylomarinum roseum TaxID=3067653 RepID=A0AAU7NR62_9GAMM|nr:hypothetical protein [Methylomarinum sp. Ch1-1]MDP4520569.1 hypothetical protein [Methylomarinum sp. Ch1-1]
MKAVGLLLLALWLITDALLKLTHWHFAYQIPLLAALALITGAILLLSVIKSRFGDIGLLLLAIWLILSSCIQLFHVSFPYSGLTLAILAIVSGVFLILRK